MQITAQSYPIPKAGGTFWFRLLSDLGMPLTLTSVSCTNSTVNSSITYDKPDYVFKATFPANSSSTNKNYNFTVNYSVNSVAHTDTFTIQQSGTSSYLYTEADVVPRPFVLSYTADFFSSEDPTNYDSVTTFLAENTSYTAPHYISISEYLTAAQNGELTDGQWVYVDGKINSSASSSYNSGSSSVSTRWIETDATPASTVYPYIYTGKLQNTGGTKFTALPSTDVRATYKTVGFKHKQNNILTSATGQYYVNYNGTNERAFVQATTTSWWTNTTCYTNSGNIDVTVPYILYYNWPVSDPTYTSLGNNEYRLARTYSSAQTTPRGIVLSVNPEGTYTGEKVFIQVPETAVNINNTDISASNTSGNKTFSLGTFRNDWFDFDSSLFSVSFPDGRPDWVNSATVSNPSSNKLRLTVNLEENTTGSQRSCNARVNWLDRSTDITITQKTDGATISLSNTLVLIPYAGGSQTVSITVSGSTLSNYEITAAGTLTITKNESSFSILVGQNPNANSERLYTPTVTVVAEDGTTASFPLYVIQKTQNITVADSAREKTYQANEGTGYFFFISEKQYTSANYSKVFGDINFTGFRYDVSNTGCGTYFTMADNETNAVQQAVVVVSCNDGSSSDSAFVIMHKNGTDGSIAISPTEVTVTGSAGTRTFTVTSNQISSSSYRYNTWGDITFDSVAYNNDHTQITASWPANDSGETKVGYLSVIGEDAYGFTKSAYTTITQEAIPELEFTDTSKTLAYDESTAYYFIKAVNVSNVNVAFRGDVSIDHHTLTATSGGYQLYVYTNNNTTASMQTTTITVSGTSGAFTLTDTATLNKKGTPGSISLNPDQVVRSYNSGSITSDIIASGVSNLQTSYWGSGGTTTITDVTMSNNTLTVTYGANNTGSRITNYASVTGEDQYGDTKRATITITQLGADPAINVTPATKTIAASATSASYTVTTTEMDNTPTATSSADWISSLTINDGSLDVTLTGANASTSPRTATITVSGRSPFGSLVTKQVTLTQKGEAGTLSISPTTYVTDGAAETKTFTVTSNGVSNIRATNTGDITFNSLNISGSTLTAVMSSNSTLSTRNGTIIVNGVDGNDDPISASATVEQRVIPTIEFGTASRTLSATETTAYYPVRVYNVENPSVSISGNVSIDHYTFTQDQSDETLYTLYVYTNDNTSTNQLTSTITVSGQSELGTAASGTGTLIKLGVGGTITLNPNSVSVTEVAGTATSTITTSGITSALTTEYWGDGGVTTVTNASVSGSTLTVTYGANNTGSTVTNYVKVSGTDSNGNTQFATFVITQTGINPEISVYPPSRTVASTDVRTTFTIMYSGVSNLTMSTTALWITDYQINNGVLSVTFGTNSTTSQRSATLTVSGTTSLGTTVSDSVTLIQEAPQGEAGSITIDPDSRTLNPTETTCMYVVTYENISSALSVSVTGDVNITDYHLEEEDFGYYLWVTTADNTGTSDLTSTFTVSGTDDIGVTRTATATLLKKAPAAGSITVEPTQKTVGYQAGSTTFAVTARNIVGNLTTEVVSSSTMSITSHSISNGTLTVAYDANTGAQKNAAIKISGTDSDGVEMWVLARLYQDQAPATYTFAFNPSGQSTKSISMSPTSVRYTIDSYKTIGSSYELGYDITNIEYTSGSWPTIINIRYEDSKPYILVPMNMTGSQRKAVIHFVQDESGREITSTLTQTSGGASTETFLPIWRDDVHTSSANDFIEYHISLGADIIYAGKAYKYPEASNIEWTINDVCSNYIGTGITFTNGIQRIPNYCKTFSVVTNDQTLTDTKFYNSWAYEDTDYWLSDPIDYRVDPRQWLPVSFLSSNSRNITVGSTAYTASASDDGWTVMTNLNNLTLDCGGTFTVTPGVGRPRNYRIDCGDFALYYANAYGGWDALLVKGTTKKTDNIEHLNYRKKSRDLSEFSKVNYQNNITPTWSLNTGLTINGQKMYHLLESTMVYLHNLNTNEIIPVVITNAQCEYLDYTNNGKKPYYYNITVEESNLKLRK